MKKRRLIAVAAAIAGVSLVLSACAPTQTAPAADGFGLRPALSGERHRLSLAGFGEVTYYADARGTGRPIILTHSVNAAASSYEMKPLWDAYAGTRPIYALDWPGFGSSDRPNTVYTPEKMTAALLALVAELGTDVDVVSLSLGSEFAAHAALRDPHIKTLALISPSGLGNPRGGSQQTREQNKSQQLYNRLNAVGDPLYAVLRTRPSLHYFLGRSFRGPVPAGVVDYAWDTSHQPGAKYAPLYFVSGKLFTPDAYADLYSKLDIPTLILYDQDAFVSFDRLPQFAQQPGVRLTRINGTDGLPQWDKPAATKAALDEFWSQTH